MIRQMLSIFVLIALGSRFAAAQSTPFADAKVIHTLPWNSDAITGVSFIGNDKVAVGNKRGDILIWNLPAPGGKASDPVRLLVGHTSEINRLIMTPDGKMLISANSSTSISTLSNRCVRGKIASTKTANGSAPICR